MTRHIYDLVGIGIGPFNLGLACLTQGTGLDAIFLDRAARFSWHPGLMISGTTVQVPFLADLVTLADPTSPFSFLNWLKHVGRLYPFYIRESFNALRTEYDAYCRWAAEQLSTLSWNHEVVAIEYDAADDTYLAVALHTDTGERREFRARHIVIGVGTEPYIPPALRSLDGPAIHSSAYLDSRDRLIGSDSITVIGSGQSAAEIYRDLLDGAGPRTYRLDWVTRSPRFFPMEYTKLTLEMTSPEYTDHFHALSSDVRERLGRDQRSLYKGISSDLINDIYDALYRLTAERAVQTTLLTDTEVVSADWDGEGYRLHLLHNQLNRHHTRETGALVFATGYAARTPSFLVPVMHRLDVDDVGRLDVARDYSIDQGRGRIFVQNAEEHTHGLTAPDLGFGAWRNSSILASITGEEVYPVERRIAFQEFGVPSYTRGGHFADAAG